MVVEKADPSDFICHLDQATPEVLSAQLFSYVSLCACHFGLDCSITSKKSWEWIKSLGGIHPIKYHYVDKSKVELYLLTWKHAHNH